VYKNLVETKLEIYLMKKKLHYHSHAAFFSGAENMLSNFFLSSEISNEYDISFSYVYSKDYEMGLRSKVNPIFPIYQIKSPSSLNFIKFSSKYPHFLVRILRFLIRSLVVCPFFIYEVIMLYKIFRSIGPDIIHINNSGYPSSLSCRIASVSAKLAGIPCVLMVVNNMAVDYMRPSRLFDFPLDMLVSRFVTQFITGSDLAGKQLKKVLKLKDFKHQTMHNGISFSKTSETNSEVRKRLGLDGYTGIIFGVVAILKPNKGHKILLESINNIVEAGTLKSSEFKVLIEGRGPMLNELKKLIDELGLSDYCILVGVEKNIVNFMSFIDVLIFPSIEYEDFPNVIIEAMGLGKPVISSILAGTSEQVIDGSTGILVEPRDSKSLELAIVKMCSDRNMLIKMGMEGKVIFDKKFTAKVAIKRYLKLYKALI
jgi:glycosyltransferase involved in cell wall biosynthesis